MFALPLKERLLVSFLETYIDGHGFSPTVRLMREALGYRSNSPIQNLLDRLEQKGVIEREKGKSRTVRLRQLATPPNHLWLKGAIAAGGVVEPFTDAAMEPLLLPDSLHQPGHYALRVIGDSMIEAHICSGDYVILRPVYDVQTLKSGSIVAARVEGEGTTLKRFYLHADRVLLEPANPQFKTINVAAERVQVQGVLVTVWRDYAVS